MHTVPRILSFIVRNLKNPLYVLRYAYAYPQSKFSNNAQFLSTEELVHHIKNGKSLLRFGDGEIYMMNFGSIPQYEPYNSKLRHFLFQIIKEYSPNSPYLIGIPVFVNSTNAELKKKGKLHVWLPLKIFYRFIFPHKVAYFDAHLFYRQGGFASTLAQELEKRKVVIVTQKYNIQLMKDADVENKLDVSFIETPERETFQIVPDILERIVAVVGNSKDDYRVVLAAGPASKILVYELSRKGIVSYDIGRGIETVYRKNEIEWLI